MPKSSSIQLIPIKCRPLFERFDLASVIAQELDRNHVRIRDGDILVVSSKYASVSEGRFVELRKIRPTRKAISIAHHYKMRPEIAQLVLNESESILGGIDGFLLALKDGVLAPNAGIDMSNAPNGWAILYPKSRKKVSVLRTKMLKILNRRGRKISKIGVILSDSRVTPTRLGTIGVALAVTGIKPTIDMRGKPDIFGNPLKVTLRALADQLATAAEICMGEADESIPVVVVRGVTQAFDRPRTKSESNMNIAPQKCLIISGLKNARNL